MVGFGPGGVADRTRRAEEAIAASDVVVGYRPYLDRIADLLAGKELHASGMRAEVDRCRAALVQAREGRTVSLVSSGDAGVYGMAGLALEMAAAEGFDVPVEVVPGVSAANAAAAKLGAPLMLDYAVVSLSDLLVPLEQILTRVEAALEADFVLALYNPRSHSRTEPFDRTMELIRTHRSPETPVGLATALGAEDEHCLALPLADLPAERINMRTVLIIGNTASRILDERFVTPRGYEL